MKKAKFESFGAEVGLNSTGQLNMEPKGNTGNLLVQSFAGMAPQSNVPVDTVPTNPNTLNATFMSFGASADLSHRPSKSFGTDQGNDEAKYSDRSVKQSS